MLFETVQRWLTDYQWLVLIVALILGYILYRLTKWALARVLYGIAIRTESIYDDLVVDRLRPFRFAWLLPLGLIYGLFYATLGPDPITTNIVLVLIIVVAVDLAIAVLNAFKDVYHARPIHAGASIAAYTDAGKVLIIAVAILFTLVVFTDSPPVTLLVGLGAWVAVLLLIFRDTILNFLASVQLSSQDLVQNGDRIEVPSFGADGWVTDMSLSTIKVQNRDNTITAIPTYRFFEEPIRNHRGMKESGGRQMVLTLAIDTRSIDFCDIVFLEKMSKYDLIADAISEQIDELKTSELDSASSVDFPLDGPQITNLHLFMEYAKAYLRRRPDIRQRGFYFLVNIAEPSRQGLPLQIEVFSKNTSLPEFSATRSEILMHLIAAMPYFGLRLFQQLTDEDLRVSSR